MDFTQGILAVLNNNDEPFSKRIKIADNAFKSSELPLQHRESFLIKWALNNDIKENQTDVWLILNSWLKSEQFKELNRNDLSNDDIQTIVALIANALSGANADDQGIKIVLNTILLLFENRIFLQYFKFNLDVYCLLISSMLDLINCPDFYIAFLKNDFVFHKNIITEEKFHKRFMDINLPSFIKALDRFDASKEVFEQTSKIIQNCIYYRNFKNFEAYLTQFFQEESPTIEKPAVPKAVLKYFATANNSQETTSCQLMFHAFCKAYSDFGTVYKMLVVLTAQLGFDLQEIITQKYSKLTKISDNDEIVLSKSLEILLEYFIILSDYQVDLEFKLNDLNLTDFIQNILKSIMFQSSATDVSYKLLSTTIAINPLIIESLIEEIIIFAMLADNSGIQVQYDVLLVALFEVFAKLHRIQNFVSKIVRTVKGAFDGSVVIADKYAFNGLNDLEKKQGVEYDIDVIFSENILECFTQRITDLASWQVMNLSSTLLFHLKSLIGEVEGIENDPKDLIYLEILATLTCSLLAGVRIAEHTVTLIVVEKFVASLNDLREILSQFGSALLKKEHNQVLMRTFLNISYTWAEVYINLAYYSINNEVDLKKNVDTDYTACNITYVHSYLSTQQWCLMSERITNFGETPCKLLLHKLFIQKLKAMLLFEPSIHDDILQNIIKSITLNLTENWTEIISDKYIMNHLVPKMESNSILELAKIATKNINDLKANQLQNLAESAILNNAINYVTFSRINKQFKQKRKHGEDGVRKSLSAQVWLNLSEDIFLNNADPAEFIEEAKELFNRTVENNNLQLVAEDEIESCLAILKRVPIIFSSENIKKIYLLYLFALHNDLSGHDKLNDVCERLIKGVIQQCKFKLLDLFDKSNAWHYIIKNCRQYESMFLHLIGNVFKFEVSKAQIEFLLEVLKDNLKNEKYLRCTIHVLNAIPKNKNSRMFSDTKSNVNFLKSTICNKIVKLSQQQAQPKLIEAYAIALRAMLRHDENDNLANLLTQLQQYLDYALDNLQSDQIKGALILFNTTLQFKPKINPLLKLEDDLVLKIWTACKSWKISELDFDEFSQVVMLVFESVSDEDFERICADLLKDASDLLDGNDCVHLKTWESIMGCRFKPVKTKIWQDSLEALLQKFVALLQTRNYDEQFYASFVHIEEIIIQTNQVLLTPSLSDILILSVALLIEKPATHFFEIFPHCIKILEALLKYRKALIMDRLPPYLQQYRFILKKLCARSSSELNLDALTVQKLANCAHQLEKLTKNLVANSKDMGRISMYLIADILEQYEKDSLYPNIKMHLNNCLYSLISLLDQHAVAFLMKVLSSASREIFKVMYDHYNKYYRFTGKV